MELINKAMNKGGNMTEGEQQLFLIEFLVDRVNVPSVRAMQEDVLPSATCVSFQILNLPPINIHQADPLTVCACPTPDNDITTPTATTGASGAIVNAQLFKKGKSCLFALPAIVFEKPLCTFPITMSVYKKLPPGVLPDVMLIGSHQIELKDLINSLIKDYVFVSGNPSKNIKDTFKIKTATGQAIGSVTVFLRVSCCGKKIVTQFQIPHNEKPFLFRGADSGPLFQCKKIDDNEKCMTSEAIAQSNNTSARGVKSPLVRGAQTAKNKAGKLEQCYMPMNDNSKSHPHMHLNSSATSENRSKFAFGESPNNLRKCGCHRPN